MKLNKKMKVLIFTFVIICINCLICIDVNAKKVSDDCTGKNALIDYFEIDTDYNGTDTVTLKVKNGSFRVTYFSDSDGVVKKPDLIDGGKKSKYYLFKNNSEVIDKNNPLVLRINDDKIDRNGAIIKLQLSFYTGNNNPDRATGCYSYDISTNSKPTFKIGSKKKAITIKIPTVGVNRNKKDVENKSYDTYCLALREHYTDYNDFVSKYPSLKKVAKKLNLNLHENSKDAREYYASLVPECWDKTVYYWDDSTFKSMVRNAIAIYHYKSMSAKVNDNDKTESWSVKFDEIVNNPSTKKYYASEQNDKKTNQQATLNNLVGADGKGSEANSKDFDLKCDFTVDSDASKFDMHDSSGKYNINANKKYFYAISKTESPVKYVYKYTGYKKGDGKDSDYYDEKDKTACTNTCEEVVEVKYGPPVASKAGICFEYQVQVTSRVKCETKMTNDAAPILGTYESPYPWCNDYPGYTHQGGPTSSYEACISDCDGGKYTKECSEKCYNSVYGSSKSNKTSNNTSSLQSTKLAYDKPFDKICNQHQGKYIIDRNDHGKVKWRSLNGKAACGYARYYYQVEYVRTKNDHLNYYFDDNGFKRDVQSDGNLCKDKCQYMGYSKKSYLNASEMYRDYKENLKAYKNAIKECSISAKCTTKTAQFSISADYYVKNSGGAREKKTTYFGDQNNTRKLESKGNSTCTNAKAPASGNILLDYNGCYKKCGDGLQYHARWSFPGTWINYKTAKRSYVVPSNKSAWYEVPDKFCTPKDILSTNDLWWKYYVSKRKGELATTGIDDEYLEEYGKMCDPSVTSGYFNTKTPTKDDIDWNIRAVTKMFGYFGWDFNISCFYALDNCDKPGSDNYTIRTVDTKNLFPASDGSDKLGYKNGEAKTGREPGFNWSAGAVSNKNPKNESTGKVGYTMNPPKLIEQIQSMAKNGTTYDDKYLDYQFVLDKDKIAKLRRIYDDLDTKMFTNGEFIYSSTNNGVARYYSYIIHGGGSIDNKFAKHSPSTSAIFCNNMVNYNSKECNNYD